MLSGMPATGLSASQKGRAAKLAADPADVQPDSWSKADDAAEAEMWQLPRRRSAGEHLEIGPMADQLPAIVQASVPTTTTDTYTADTYTADTYKCRR